MLQGEEKTSIVLEVPHNDKNMCSNVNNVEAFSSQITQKNNFLSPQRESNP